MRDTEAAVRWAPRVNPIKVRKRYSRDALGIVDEDTTREEAVREGRPAPG